MRTCEDCIFSEIRGNVTNFLYCKLHDIAVTPTDDLCSTAATEKVRCLDCEFLKKEGNDRYCLHICSLTGTNVLHPETKEKCYARELARKNRLVGGN